MLFKHVPKQKCYLNMCPNKKRMFRLSIFLQSINLRQTEHTSTPVYIFILPVQGKKEWRCGGAGVQLLTQERLRSYKVRNFSLKPLPKQTLGLFMLEFLCYLENQKLHDIHFIFCHRPQLLHWWSEIFGNANSPGKCCLLCLFQTTVSIVPCLYLFPEISSQSSGSVWKSR